MPVNNKWEQLFGVPRRRMESEISQVYMDMALAIQASFRAVGSTAPEVVPEGKTCLCCEMYCFGPDKLLQMDDTSTAKLALDDCARSGLLDPAKCFDHLVLRLPGADATQNRDNWMSPSRLKLQAELEQFKNLYYVNRTETDIATLAGLEAAEAILSDDRSHFDKRVNPAELGIRSESKAFEFQLPVSVDS